MYLNSRYILCTSLCITDIRSVSINIRYVSVSIEMDTVMVLSLSDPFAPLLSSVAMLS